MNNVTKAITAVVVTLVLSVIGCQSSPEPSDVEGPLIPVEESAQAGAQAPSFELQSLDGQLVSLSDLGGKPVLVNFWATWCPPCRSEMPYLQQVYEEWSDRGLVMLAINIGESQAEVKAFLETQDLSLQVLLDTDQGVALKYDIIYIPTTFFIDKDGIIQEKMIGAFPSKEAIEEYLSKIIP